MPTEQLTDEIGRSISNLRALAKITAAGAELYACANTLERARLRITELESVGAQLESFVAELSEQGDHNALDMLDKLRRGYVDRYEAARATFSKAFP